MISSGAPLAIKPVPAVGLDDHRHDLAAEIEGNLIDLAGVIQRQLAMRQDGAVQHVLQAGLEVAVQIGGAQDVVAVFADDVAVFFQDDAVHGERAGLIGAEHVHGAEVLERPAA